MIFKSKHYCLLYLANLISNEFICDIKAASERQHDGNLLLSIENCANRFHIDNQLKQILINTAKMIDEQA